MTEYDNTPPSGKKRENKNKGKKTSNNTRPREVQCLRKMFCEDIHWDIRGGYPVGTERVVCHKVTYEMIMNINMFRMQGNS